MPPCLDVYVRLPHLDRRSVEDFLERHVPQWREATPWLVEDATEILDAALAGHSSGETLYASGCLDSPDLEFVMVAFPRDSGVVLGVSIDLDPDEDAAEVLAGQWLDRLLDQTGAPQGFVQFEEPPPLTESGWQVEMSRARSSRSRERPV